MQKFSFSVALIAVLVSPVALSIKNSPIYCSVIMIPDSTIPPFSYRAILRVSPHCPDNGVAYVRKTSWISTKENGARYQPMLPGGLARFGGKWSWKLTPQYSQVPPNELWTINLWEWQYFDGQKWVKARTP